MIVVILSIKWWLTCGCVGKLDIGRWHVLLAHGFRGQARFSDSSETHRNQMLELMLVQWQLTAAIGHCKYGVRGAMTGLGYEEGGRRAVARVRRVWGSWALGSFLEIGLIREQNVGQRECCIDFSFTLIVDRR